MAQTLGLLVKTPGLPLLARVEQAKFMQPIFPGDHITIKAKLENEKLDSTLEVGKYSKQIRWLAKRKLFLRWRWSNDLFRRTAWYRVSHHTSGMARVAKAPLVAAVSEAGGLGVLGGAAMTPEELRNKSEK